MKVDIRSEDSAVFIDVAIEVPGTPGFVYHFRHPGGEEDYAAFLVDAIEKQFIEHVATIRRNAYNAGWEDKTKRKKRVTDFDYCANYTRPPQ